MIIEIIECFFTSASKDMRAKLVVFFIGRFDCVTLQFAYAVLGHYGFLSYNKEIMDFLAKDVCNDISDVLCENILFIIGGFDRTHLNQVRELQPGERKREC